MTVKEFYDVIGGGYEDVLSRMLKDERIVKYLRRFPEDPSYGAFFEQLEAENYEEAFRNVHTLKGLALNLGLEKLGEASSAVCEELRPKVAPDKDISGMIETLREEYNKVMENLGNIEG